MMQIGIYLLILLIPFQIYFNFGRNVIISVAQISAIVFFLLVLWRQLKLKNVFRTQELLDWAIMSLILVMAVSIPLSSDKAHSLKCFVKWTSFITIYFSVSRSLDNITIIKRSLMCFLFIATVVSVMGLIEYSVGFPAIYDWLKQSTIMPYIIHPNTLKYKLSTDTFNYVVHNWADMSKSGIRAFGTSDCAIEFSAYLGLIIPFTPWFMRKKNRYTVLSFVFIGIILTALFLNFSRSAYLSLIAVGIMYAYYLVIKSKSPLPRNLVVFTTILITVLSMTAFLSPNFKRTLGHRLYSPIPVEYTRPHIWKNALKIFVANPVLGVGIANYQGGLDKYITDGSPSLPAHNQYLQVAAETGMLGLIVYLSILSICIYYSFIIFKNTYDQEIRLLALGFLGMWMWYCLQSNFDTYLFGDKFSMIFWLMVGLNIALYNIYRKEKTAASAS